ncbi:hypothetical protein JNW88_01505 [Micromonospora sp. ATA32]|nr:hypothetical protein [Micromonospora sp. ATA32]
MNFRNRPLARLGAAALLASGAFTALGAPAQAAGTETDLSIDAVGTRTTSKVEEKVAWAKIKNLGPNTPSELMVHIDLNALEFNKFTVWPANYADCQPDNYQHEMKGWYCPVPAEQLPGPGETLELPLLAFRLNKGTTTSVGEATFTIISKDDTNPANNTKVAKVELTAESGVDLGLVVPDVKTRIDWKKYDEVDGSEPALHPGDATTAFAYIVNQGDLIADGVDLKITLPKGVVFGADLKECGYTADRRTADCRGGLIQLKPGEDRLGVFPVKVAAGLKAPVSLAGGAAEVSSRGALPVGAKSLAPGAAQLPSFLREAAATDVPKGADLDDSDNSDDFAVIVAAKAADGGTGGGGGDDDGGLPVTGPQAGLIGSVGVAAAVAGGMLYLAARRRRVVLVTPGDEKPTA